MVILQTHQIKSLVERLLGNRVWLEPSLELDSLEAFISELKPVNVGIPLVRIGSKQDGGYLVPDDLEGLKACVSPGVSTEIGFDLEMAERGIPVYMADASVPGPPVDHDIFNFFPKFLDVFEDEKNMRLDTLCGLMPDAHRGDAILQMDIEGAEYRVLLDASDDTLSQFRIILLECHNLTRLFGRQNSQLIIATFRKLLRHFHVVHIHPNNVCPASQRGGISIPPVMEFTFIRKDRVRSLSRDALTFPHPLDRDNMSNRPSLALPETWR